MMSVSEVDLLTIEKGSVTAPAGCGKTQLIADALCRHAKPKPVLVLTHTNAGVAALRGRLDRAGAVPSRYRLSTLDGFAMRLIKTFPARSGHNPDILQLARPASDYPAIRDAALNLLANGHLADVIPATYDRVFIDEYQDCSDVQHELAMAIAEMIPACVLGDPLQAIFGFKGNTLVDWENRRAGVFRARSRANNTVALD
jgi:superfamily I DNA/RNA helicase